MMKSVFWWRKPEYPEETIDLRQESIEKSVILFQEGALSLFGFLSRDERTSFWVTSVEVRAG